MSFASDLKRYGKKLNLSLDEVAVSVCSQVVKSVIEKTPVDKGGAKSNWVATINKPYSGLVKSKDATGSIAIGKGLTVAKQASGNIFYLTNNLSYIRKLEYGGYSSGPKIVGGFSTQAPNGMVRITMQNIKSNLKKFK